MRYLLEGSIRKVADHARIAVQLVDGLLHHDIWAEQYDRDIVDLFAVQAEICDKVMAAVEPQLYLAERIRAERTRPECLNAWECIVRALSLMNTREKTNAANAHGLLQKAVSVESEMVRVTFAD